MHFFINELRVKEFLFLRHWIKGEGDWVEKKNEAFSLSGVHPHMHNDG